MSSVPEVGGAHVATPDLNETTDPAPAVAITPTALGVVGAALALLAGGWLMYAPAVFGYQPAGAPWSAATKTDFYGGLGLAVLGLAGLVVMVVGLVAALRARGALAPRHASEPEPEPEPAPTTPAPADELGALLRPLIEALNRDNAAEQSTAAHPHRLDEPTLHQERS